MNVRSTATTTTTITIAPPSSLLILKKLIWQRNVKRLQEDLTIRSSAVAERPRDASRH